MNELWLTLASEDFWQSAGGYTTDFELAALSALPVCIERLPGLSVTTAWQWLERNGVILLPIADRSLRACLVALGGESNYILLDETDDPVEQQFSLAHEVAHYWLDYHLPREQASLRLSFSALEVLDGLRPPTPEERLEGILANVPVKALHHLMERNDHGQFAHHTVLRSEERADLLALELLAPLETVLPQVRIAIKNQPGYQTQLQEVESLLTGPFKLPLSVVGNYTRRLVDLAGGGKTFREWLGIKQL